MQERKILIITNRVPYPLKDGGNLAMDAMIEGYHNAGWQVYLLSMNTSKHHIAHTALKKLFTHLHAFEWVDVDNKLKRTDILRNFLFSKQPEHAGRFYNEAFRQKLKNILTSFRPDVVQVESVYLTTYMKDIKKNAGVITVLRLHNVEYQIWQSLADKSKNPVKRLYLENLTKRVRDFERDAWKQYNLLLAITEKDASVVLRLEEMANVTVAPFSIDVQKIQPPDGNERWVGYHIGAMDWIANQSGIRWFLHHAWPMIHKALPRFEFYFAGRNMPDEFKKMNIDGVYCLDEVPSAEDFIADKKILIVPLLSGGGIRVKILEAMAAGKVVISTSTGIKGIDAKPGEHYLKVHKPEDFVKAIKWCLNNKEAAENMAIKARTLVAEKYENSKVIKKVIDEVESLLGRKK